MRLRDVFLIEGAADTENRRRAQEYIREIISIVGRELPINIDEPELSGPVDFPHATWSLASSDIPELQNMTVTLQASKEPIRGWHLHWKNGKHEIQILVDPEEFPDPSIDIRKATQSVLLNYEDILVHELTHFMDVSRYKDQSASTSTSFKKKTGEYDWDKYANSPLEFNAHFQQVAHRIEDRLAGAERMSDVKKKFLARNADEFVKRVMSPKGELGYYIKHLNPTYKKKFAKRLAQFWQELERELPP